MTETTTAAEADVPSLLAAANLALNALHECIVPKGAELQISDAMRALRSAIDANLTSAARPLLAAEHKGWKVDYSGLISQVHRAAERLGFVRVWTKTDFRDLKRTGYDVKIMGRRRNTTLEIKRRHTSLECALADAINEAREMGLGEPS